MAGTPEPDPTRDASRRDAAPDPTSDEWTAWLPDLDSHRPAGATGGGAPPAPGTPAPPPNPALPYPPAPTAPPPRPRATRPPTGDPLPPPRPGRWTSAQPAPTGLTPGAPPSFLLLAIVALIALFPLGLVAVLRAVSVSALWATGRHQEAWAASRSARRWAVAAIVVSFFFVTVALSGAVTLLAGLAGP
ncbi:CD225/dispanin family protein [Intrasporangium flavum]|uniref:CD225/dispanin family protein n=1 Tax=Intrasporangium flavum TaxID=1428657 RepID=UPI00096FE86B|nr:CD225/dispanin family protein [Intrasporangium flavum]